MNLHAQMTGLRMRMYVNCSERARLIDLLDGNRPHRVVEFVDLLRHDDEDHDSWLELLEIDEI